MSSVVALFEAGNRDDLAVALAVDLKKLNPHPLPVLVAAAVSAVVSVVVAVALATGAAASVAEAAVLEAVVVAASAVLTAVMAIAEVEDLEAIVGVEVCEAGMEAEGATSEVRAGNF